MNDVHVWTLRGPSKWVSFRTIEGRAPLPRSYHSVVAVGSKLVVFGGNDDVQSFGDLAYLECTTTVSAPDTWSWHWPSALGKGPSARTGASAVCVGERYIVVTGGWDPKVQVRAAAVAAKAAKAGGGGAGKAQAASRGGTKRNSGGEAVGAAAAEKAAVAAAVAEVAAAEAAAAAAGATSARGLPYELALAASASLRAIRVRGEAEGEGQAEGGLEEEQVREPFPEAWVLDTLSWEWFRVAGEVPGCLSGVGGKEGPTTTTTTSSSSSSSSSSSGGVPQEALEALKCAAGRAGHCSIFLEDASALLKCGAAAGSSAAAEALAGMPSEYAPMPAIFLHGGLKADGARHGDSALLLLPSTLAGVAAGSGGSSGGGVYSTSQVDFEIPLAQQ